MLFSENDPAVNQLPEIPTGYKKAKYYELLDLRYRLLDLGYEPIPVGKDTKRPVVDGWPEGEITRTRIIDERWAHRTAILTGLRTGRLVAVDIDLIPEPHTLAICDDILTVFGPSPLMRFGSKGRAFLYRLADGEEIPKWINIRARLPGDPYLDNGGPKHPHGVEILGWHRQLACFGEHAKVKRPYLWSEGVSPLDVPFHELPAVTFEQVHKLADLITANLPDLGYALPTGERYTGGKAATTYEINRDDPVDMAEATSLFYSRIPGGARMVNGWLTFDCPACGDDEGKGAFATFGSGWRYKCWRAQCDYHDPTGWEPEPGRCFSQRHLDLFELLGGDRRDLQPYEFWGERRDTLAEQIAQIQEMDPDERNAALKREERAEVERVALAERKRQPSAAIWPESRDTLAKQISDIKKLNRP